MITVKIEGGLGNQMFQYAAAKNLSVLHGVDLQLDVSAFNQDKSSGVYTGRKFELDQLNIKAHISKKNHQTPGLFKKIKDKLSRTRYYFEQSLNFDAEVLKLPSNAYLEGYFQSEKYFTGIRNLLLEEFEYKVREVDKPEFAKYMEKIQKPGTVAVHIRRGDFANNKFIHSVHGTCSLEYYEAAIAKIEKLMKPSAFFIFSDDLNWAVENLGKKYEAEFVKLNSNCAHLMEMKLMSKANANIIANSSFSWWGAWLNANPSKIVIAPQNWYVEPLKNSQTSYLLPDSWICI